MKSSSFLCAAAATMLFVSRPVSAEQTPVINPPGAGGGAVANATAAAEIQFETPIFDFGKAITSQPVKHNYIFTNTGNAKLIISKVEPKCGCTVTSAWTQEVEPGQTGVIPIQFNTTGYNGPVTKYVGVTCNAKSTPDVMLQLKGIIHTLLEVIPQRPTLIVLSDSETNAVTVVRIVNHGESPVTLSPPQSSNHGVIADLKTVKAGQEFELTLKTVPPVAPGNGEAAITIKTSMDQVPLLTVQALLFSRPAVMVSPSTLLLPPGPATGVITNMIRILNLSSNYPSLTLSDPSANFPGVGVKMRESVPGKSFELMLTFPPGFEVPNNTNIEISVKSSHPQFSVIKVPVIQRPAALMPTRPVARPGRGRPPLQAPPGGTP